MSADGSMSAEEVQREVVAHEIGRRGLNRMAEVRAAQKADLLGDTDPEVMAMQDEALGVEGDVGPGGLVPDHGLPRARLPKSLQRRRGEAGGDPDTVSDLEEGQRVSFEGRDARVKDRAIQTDVEVTTSPAVLESDGKTPVRNGQILNEAGERVKSDVKARIKTVLEMEDGSGEEVVLLEWDDSLKQVDTRNVGDRFIVEGVPGMQGEVTNVTREENADGETTLTITLRTDTGTTTKIISQPYESLATGQQEMSDYGGRA